MSYIQKMLDKLGSRTVRYVFAVAISYNVATAEANITPPDQILEDSNIEQIIRDTNLPTGKKKGINETIVDFVILQSLEYGWELLKAYQKLFHDEAK